MRRVLSYIVALIMPLVASAQVLPFVSADYSAASIAKAGTDATETSSVALSALGNVAAVPFSGKSADFAVGYTLWQPSYLVSNVITAGGAYNLDGKFGFSLGMTYGSWPEYDIFNETGVGKGTFSPSDIQVRAGASWRFLPFLSAGVNLGYASSSLAEDVAYGAFVSDVFLMSKLADCKVSLGVANLGSAVVSASGDRFSLPSSMVLGVGYDKLLADTHNVEFAVDMDYYFDGALAVSACAEYSYKDIFSVCTGYRYGGSSLLPSYLSVGAGAGFYGVRLDVAYVIPVSDSPLSNTLSLQLGYSF